MTEWMEECYLCSGYGSIEGAECVNCDATGLVEHECSYEEEEE